MLRLRRRAILAATCFTILFAAPCRLFAASPADPQDISSALERIRNQHDVPALAAAAVDEGQIVGLGAAGRRSVLREIEVTLDDKWQIGSCTKSMTASVAAMLVEDGKLRWDSTIAEIFPETTGEMDAAWRAVRLEQLLVHRAGAPHDPPADLWREAGAQHGTPTEQRWAYTKGLLAREPARPPGTAWEYSDSGYAIVGAMMERVTGVSWEELLRTRLFQPLGMKSAGFGPPASPDKIDQPWGHHGKDAPYTPVPPGPDIENPPSIGPAATVHCSISDFAKYAAWHVAGARGEASLLRPESFKKLHTPPEEKQYAMGWAVTKRPWAGGNALMHTGETATFYAVIWLGPAENTAFLAVCNADSYEAGQACDDAIRMLINRF